MRNYLLAAVAAAALTSPALARDKSTYVGIEGGLMLVEDTNLDYNYDGPNGTIDDVGDALTIDHKVGFDVDLIAGYDFGVVRAEAELGYKRASLDEVQIDTNYIPTTNPTAPYDVDGKVSVLSLMGNVLFDFGDEDNWSGYLGAGAGWARVKYNVEFGCRTSGRRIQRKRRFDRLADHCGHSQVDHAEHRPWPEVPFLQRLQARLRRLQRRHFLGELRRSFPFAQPPAEPRLQFLHPGTSASAAAAAPAPASASARDADVPGWVGDPGDRGLPAAAAAAAAAAGTGARLSSDGLTGSPVIRTKIGPAGEIRRVFSIAVSVRALH